MPRAAAMHFPSGTAIGTKPSRWSPTAHASPSSRSNRQHAHRYRAHTGRDVHILDIGDRHHRSRWTVACRGQGSGRTPASARISVTDTAGRFMPGQCVDPRGRRLRRSERTARRISFICRRRMAGCAGSTGAWKILHAWNASSTAARCHYRRPRGGFGRGYRRGAGRPAGHWVSRMSRAHELRRNTAMPRRPGPRRPPRISDRQLIDRQQGTTLPDIAYSGLRRDPASQRRRWGPRPGISHQLLGASGIA